MKMQRREFMGVVGGSFVSASTPGFSRAVGPNEAGSKEPDNPASPAKEFTVSAGGIAVDLTRQGKIVAVTFTDKKVHRAVQGITVLAECELSPRVI